MKSVVYAPLFKRVDVVLAEVRYKFAIEFPYKERKQ
jgi:hypothetical protein